MRILLLSFLMQVLFAFTTQSQSYVVQGKVIDINTGLAIPYVSVGLKDFPKGTSSNGMGEFQLRIDSLPVSLVFRHISYDRFEQVVSSEVPLTIKLEPSKVVLKGIVVKGKKKENYLYGLINKAFARVQQYNNRNYFGKAYYRQLSKNGEDYTGLYEIFFDAAYSRRGIRNWAIQEGRYALKTSSGDQAYIYNKNFTLLCRMLSMIQPGTKDLLHPVSKNAELYYDFKMKNILDVDGRKIGVISFIPKRTVAGPAVEGELYLDIENFDLLKITGRIKNDHLKFITLNMKGGKWKNYILSFEMAYKTSADDDLVMDYISLDQSFDYYLKDEFMHPVTTHALLSFYEYYIPETHKRLGGRLNKYWRRDRDVLDKIGYNKDFWAENPIVRRTPVEKDVITSFENANAFGSIYLNNKEHIVFEGDELRYDPVIVGISDSLRKSRYASVGEKLYIHVNKSLYISGETLWFSTYLVNAASHIPGSSSGLAYVELVNADKTIIAQKRVYLEDGGGYGQIDLPDSLSEGVYQLRAYTNWMRNFGEEWFFHQPLYVFNANKAVEYKKNVSVAKKDIDLQFFAEGGELIAGIPVQVAFKAVGQDGIHADVSGIVFNSSGKKILDFSSDHFGMGSFILLAQKSESYYAEIDGSKAKYKLPEVKSSGVSLMVNALKPEGIELLIRGTSDYSDMDFYLVAQMRGVIFHQYKSRLQNMIARVEIPKSKFPNGVLQITLFDNNGMPVCERLVFINNEQIPYVKFSVEDNVLTPRKEVGVHMQLKDAEGKTVRKARLSVSVTDTSFSVSPKYFEDIRTWLLLNSDLKGDIEVPGYYFERNDKEHLRNLDLVMLTHGWRRFTWESVLQAATPKYSYAHESGINITGKVYKKGTKKVLDQVFLSFIPINLYSDELLDVITDSEGRFSFQNIPVIDTTSYMIMARNGKGRQVEVDVVFDSLAPPDVTYNLKSSRILTDNINLHTTLSGDEYRKFIEELLKDKNTIILNEVTIQPQKKRYGGRIYMIPDEVIVVDEKNRQYDNALQLLQGNVAGLMITGTGPNATIKLRGLKSITDFNTTPLILIDGMPVNGRAESNPVSTDDLAPNIYNPDEGIQALLSLSVQDIERIEVLKGNSAAIFGSRASKGVIAVYTRRGQGLKSLPGTSRFQQLRLRGFSVEREFYIPDYRISTNTLEKPDYRNALYWNPDILINKNGWARFSFFNNDNAKHLQVIIQGLTADGVPVSAITWIGE